MNVYILTEVTKRKLDPNILLALIVAQKASTVLISNMDKLEHLISWKQMLNEEENITINNDNNFNAVLAGSDLLIQNECTTAFQAAIYDILVISYVVQNKQSLYN